MGYSIFDETMVDMSWPEIEEAAGKGAIVLLPTGIIEEHGPHMGLAVDMYIAYLISVLTKHELEDRGISTLIAPPYYWGASPSTSTFAGTFSVRKETMKAVIFDILASLQRWGLNRVFIVNWHADYSHCLAILDGVKDARGETGIEASIILTESDVRRLRLTGEEEFVIIQETPPLEGEPKEYVDLHAGSLETGIMLRYFPQQVNAALAQTLRRTELTYNDLKGLGKSDEATRKLIPGGYFGDPAGYDTEKAGRYIETYSQNLANAIKGYLDKS
jgi:creatinine amidohydrolase